jgi:hypothetical protein
MIVSNRSRNRSTLPDSEWDGRIEKHRKMHGQAPIPAFSNTSRTLGIPEKLRLFAFLRADKVTPPALL